MNSLKTVVISLCLLVPASIAYADRTEVPEKYYEHGLIEDAKRGFIDITLDRKAEEDEKAKSLSALGDIAFDENKISLALDTWKELIETYPDSQEAKLVSERLDQIGQLVESTTDNTLDNAIARSYIRHGDWWSRGKEETVSIDTSWIPNDDVAIAWYERVLSEFPDSPSALLALKKKFYTVYGWEEPGQYGNTYGVKKTGDVGELIDVFLELKTAAPDDVDLQRFRYMIAQTFWNKRKFDDTREWLQKVIDEDDGRGGFYGDLAKWRMKKVEY